MKRLINTVLLIISFPLSLFALSDWVKSYGLQHADWPDSQFLTGFAMDNATDARALERAKEVALNDLVQKINVRIKSEQIIKETGNKSHSQTDYGMIINASSDLDISGVEYLVERKGGNLYVLAHVRRTELADFYALQADEALSGLVRIAREAEKAGKSLTRLYDVVLPVPTLTGQFEESTMRIRLVSGKSDIWGRVGVTGCSSGADYTALKDRLADLLARTGGDRADNFEEAVEKITVNFKLQKVPGGGIEGGPFSYGETALSSEFGTYAGEIIRSRLSSQLSLTRGNVRIKGATIGK